MTANGAGSWIMVAGILLASAGCGITDPSDGSRASSVTGTVVNGFTEAPLGGVSVRLVESGGLVVPDRIIAPTSTAIDGTFTLTYASEGVRCDRLVLQLEHDDYALAGESALWWVEGSVRVAGCGSRTLRPEMAPRPVHVALSPAELTVSVGERVTFSVAVHYADGSVLAAKRWVAGTTYGLVSLRPEPTWEPPEECGMAAHHNGEVGIYDAPLSPPPASCGAAPGAVWVWAEHPDGWHATSDSLLVRVVP